MNDDRQAVRAAAIEAVRDVLGVEPTEEALLERIGRQLPAEEVEAIVAAVDSARRRPYALAAVAAASLAIDELGVSWWFAARKRTGVSGAAPDDRSPAVLVRSGEDIERLSHWAEDDVADQLWGPPAAAIDLNDPDVAGKYVVPPGTRPGDRLLLAFEPGRRLRAVAQEQGIRFDADDDDVFLVSSTAALWWNWATATDPELIP